MFVYIELALFLLILHHHLLPPLYFQFSNSSRLIINGNSMIKQAMKLYITINFTISISTFIIFTITMNIFIRFMINQTMFNFVSISCDDLAFEVFILSYFQRFYIFLIILVNIHNYLHVHKLPLLMVVFLHSGGLYHQQHQLRL